MYLHRNLGRGKGIFYFTALKPQIEKKLEGRWGFATKKEANW